jgi:hypothetical protein
MPKKFFTTTTVKSRGRTHTAIYSPQTWGLQMGQVVYLSLWPEDVEPLPDTTLGMPMKVRKVSAHGTLAVTIPKVFGCKPGQWVTLKIEVRDSDA